MSLITLGFIAYLFSSAAYLGMKRFSPRHIGAGTGLVVGLVLLYLIQVFIFVLMVFRLVLMGGNIHRVFAVYFFPFRMLRTIIGSSNKYQLDAEQWSTHGLVASALVWAFLGCITGHLMDRRRAASNLASRMGADSPWPGIEPDAWACLTVAPLSGGPHAEFLGVRPTLQWDRPLLLLADLVQEQIAPPCFSGSRRVSTSMCMT